MHKGTNNSLISLEILQYNEYLSNHLYAHCSFNSYLQVHVHEIYNHMMITTIGQIINLVDVSFYL